MSKKTRTRTVANEGEPSVTPEIPGAHKPFLVTVLFLFLASGCAALIYEVVWYQLLQLVIGSTAVSLGVLLATFMGGLCAGSLLLPRYLKPGMHPLRAYAFIEFGIGACGILALFGMPLIDTLYVAAVGHGFPAMILRAVIAAVCLLPPTALMGASLPAASRWVKTSPTGVGWLGLFYASNTVGAVFGCLLAGFYLLRVHDMTTATFVAAAINGAVGLVSLQLSKRAPAEEVTDPDPTNRPTVAGANWSVLTAIALSGACALGAEVVWTRLLGLLLGPTVYTFAIILAVFLVGLGIGSSSGSFLARRVQDPRIALGWSQTLAISGIAWAAYCIAESLPYWPINPMLTKSAWITLQLDVARCLWAVLPSALMWGASFPLALAAVAEREPDSARAVGIVYASNTGGAILGALLFSTVLIPSIGTKGSERVLISLAVAAAIIAVISRLRRMAAVAAALVAVLAGATLAGTVSDVPGALVAYGRLVMTLGKRVEVLFTGEGMNASVAITKFDDGAIQFHISGKVEASTEPYDMRLQRMLGHLPALMHKDPQSALVVGFGAGVTAGSFTVYPGLKRLVICEMEPLVPQTANRFFARENYGVLTNSRTQMVYDDARHFVLTTNEKFDVITSDPIHPWVKGSATLYSKEYFELVKSHLNPGGVITQWVPLYESNFETVKSEIATFFDVFPNGTIWGNESSGGGYDIVLLATLEKPRIDLDELQQKLERPDYARVVESLNDVVFRSPTHLLSTFAGQASDLKPWLAGAAINRDGNLRLQYLAGLALNSSQEAFIYEEMLRYRRFPDELFTGSPERRERLRAALGLR